MNNSVFIISATNPNCYIEIKNKEAIIHQIGLGENAYQHSKIKTFNYDSSKNLNDIIKALKTIKNPVKVPSEDICKQHCVNGKVLRECLNDKDEVIKTPYMTKAYMDKINARTEYMQNLVDLAKANANPNKNYLEEVNNNLKKYAKELQCTKIISDDINQKLKITRDEWLKQHPNANINELAEFEETLKQIKSDYLSAYKMVVSNALNNKEKFENMSEKYINLIQNNPELDDLFTKIKENISFTRNTTYSLAKVKDIIACGVDMSADANDKTYTDIENVINLSEQQIAKSYSSKRSFEQNLIDIEADIDNEKFMQEQEYVKEEMTSHEILKDYGVIEDVDKIIENDEIIDIDIDNR